MRQTKKNQKWMKKMEDRWERADTCEHDYTTHVCPICGQHFCWSCCGATNVHQGGKYDDDFMLCPKCGHDICQDN